MTARKANVELPRLTSSLRAFSALSSPYLRDGEYGQPDELKRKRKWQAKQIKEGFSWQDLNRMVKKNVAVDKANEVKNALRDLLNIAYEIAGKDASSEVTNSTAIFLFELLREPSFVSKNELSKIAETFGPCERSLIDDAYKLTQLLLSNIPEDELNKRKQNSTKHENQHAFGEGILFSFLEPVEFKADLTLFDNEVENEKPKFSLKVNIEPSKAEAVKVPQEHRENWVTPTNVDKPGDITWLKAKCDLYFGNAGEHLNSGDMCSVIFDLLSSSQGNEEMQNELFELLGFDRFEFIQELLSNREQIITGGNGKAVENVNDKGFATNSTKNYLAKPNYGCQVTIQSEQEKKIQKQVHKEEQKSLRRNKIEDRDSENHEDYLKSVGFDPEMMKYCREQALIEAANKLNEYWNEKKGFVKSSTNSIADQTDLEPQEVQALPDQTWVQCDDRTCLKWRKLPDGIDPYSLPEKWYCFMNPDPNFKSCDVPEEKEEEKTSIAPYQKTQKRRLVKEMEEKQKREKAAKLALIQEQEDKKKELEKREELLKKKEELLNSKLQTVQHENYNKTKIKVEGGSLPTAQVAPRPTPKPLNAVTPTAKPSPRQIGSQLAARLNQSATRTPQTNQSGRSPVKAKLSPALARSNQSAPSSTQVSQSTPKSSLNSSQLASRIAQTNQSTSSISTASQSASKTPTKRLLVSKANQATKSPNRQNVTILETKTESGQSVKIIAQSQKLSTTGITFKMVKAPNGTTYLVQEKNSQGTTTTTGTKPTATVVKASGPALAAISASVGSPATGQTKSPSISVKPAVAAVANTTVDVKPRLNVLPKPQISTAQTAVVRQPNGTSTQNTTRTVNKTPANVNVKPSLSLAASAYSEITGNNTTTTPQDVRNILASGIKREAAENVVSPIPAKVQRTKPDAAVIVIDPLPTQQEKSSESDAQKRIKELENRVKTLDNELSEVKTEGKNRLDELVEELQEKSRMLIRRNKEFEEKKDELQSKQNELREKTRQLKVLRGNVCKLLQVLVPEIDVESEGDGDTVDDLLRQVLEANK